ncbi:hypothetical protein UFOVP225_12 [uncultured Caudovirales phage]|uniref:Uncharacterized protein n=1 Tax=uncultured Caudovirales phage TaxID=2100421 RepID=A0A6J7WSC1_9CAUD|nr:hypothetical protein UFOVP113_25 [uncultured Caudovirales phage]CAB5218984.1 hypothetical protein UFOVP225_12 [uncultured Caudovirales phage]
MSEDNFTSVTSVVEAAIAEVNEEPEVVIETVAPSNTDVLLPGGFIAGDGSLVKYAEVRELNGVDEEAIAKTGTPGKALMAMLQRGLVSIGTEKATKEDLDKMLSGDRDAVLIGIRRVTFGDEIDFEFPCDNCKTDLKVTVNLATDVPYKNLEDPIEDRRFVYQSKSLGEVKVSLPSGLTQRKLLENIDKSRAELNTILLAGCVDSIGGVGSLGASSVLKLGMKDREQLVNEIITRTPGPRLGEVKTTCEACGEDIPMPLSLADLFRL